MKKCIKDKEIPSTSKPISTFISTLISINSILNSLTAGESALIAFTGTAGVKVSERCSFISRETTSCINKGWAHKHWSR